MAMAARFGRAAVIAALALGYAFLAHYTNIAHDRNVGTLVALAPLLLAAFSLAWQSPKRAPMLMLFAAACAALWAAWPALRQHFSLLYWMEHAGTELILCLAFGRTLAPGREPMCTMFARLTHGHMSLQLERYSRKVTLAWVIFFGSMAVASTVLFVASPIDVWSAFANFFTAPLIILMFIAEYAVRRRLNPDVEHAGILAGVRAFWNSPARR